MLIKENDSFEEENFKKFMQHILHENVDAMMTLVNADPDLKDVHLPKEIEDEILQNIKGEQGGCY